MARSLCELLNSLNKSIPNNMIVGWGGQTHRRAYPSDTRGLSPLEIWSRQKLGVPLSVFVDNRQTRWFIRWTGQGKGICRKSTFDWNHICKSTYLSLGGTSNSVDLKRADVAQLLFLLASRPNASGLGIDINGGEVDLAVALDVFINEEKNTVPS